MLHLVEIGSEGEGRSLDVMGINQPDNLADIADLGLRQDEIRRLLAGLQQEIVATRLGSRPARAVTAVAP